MPFESHGHPIADPRGCDAAAKSGKQEDLWRDAATGESFAYCIFDSTENDSARSVGIGRLLPDRKRGRQVAPHGMPIVELFGDFGGTCARGVQFCPAVVGGARAISRLPPGTERGRRLEDGNVRRHATGD